MEWYTSADGKYRIESLTSTTFPGALKVIREAFCPEENVCIGTELSKNPVAIEELLAYCADAALYGVSLVAIATDTGEVAAAAFNKLECIEPEEDSFYETYPKQCTQPSTLAVISWLDDIEKQCNFLEKFGVDCSMDLMFLGTDKNHRKKNLGTLLFQQSIEVAKKLKDGPVAKMVVRDLGPEFAYMKEKEVSHMTPKICQSLLTAEATQKIGKNIGFTVVHRESFKNYVYEGKTFEERIGRELYVEAAALKLFENK